MLGKKVVKIHKAGESALVVFGDVPLHGYRQVVGGLKPTVTASARRHKQLMCPRVACKCDRKYSSEVRGCFMTTAPWGGKKCQCIGEITLTLTELEHECMKGLGIAPPSLQTLFSI